VAGMPNPPSKHTVVQVGEFVSDIIDIDELNESLDVDVIFQYKWHDDRLAFDPKIAGKQYKLFQGQFQFDEVFSGWWPQISILNEIGSPQIKAVQIRVFHNGDVVMREHRSLNVEAPMNLSKFPFDTQHLNIYMIPFGSNTSEVQLIVDPSSNVAIADYIKNNPDVNIAEWDLVDYNLTGGNYTEDYYGVPAESSKLTLQLVLDRKPSSVIWKLLVPLSLLVMGMWSVFWMDTHALSDRLNVSFIGILSVIAYQFLIEGEMPRIDYFTFADLFLLTSFFILFTGLAQSVAVHRYTVKGQNNKAKMLDIIFRICFPLAYVLVIMVSYYIYIYRM
jgi:hypothetical protein